LIATPDRIYGWRQENLAAIDVPPQFTGDAQKELAPYFSKLGQSPVCFHDCNRPKSK
jgi:hypothetical protein